MRYEAMQQGMERALATDEEDFGRDRRRAANDGIYDGAELRPSAARKGAMDAFALPSRMGSRLIFRDGTVREAAR